ncbi:Alpha/Beta hydrolase protein [Elsinoe ampelina]|uniref:Alpha/Beta hydrolase protein n=1 Tax=Elsinoe ampelina TaxID=302913 RepID=A0A6A6GKG0_9PEZI|nr:Alpha/Beta hydrolase protein [Elsinoe ampelina]
MAAILDHEKISKANIIGHDVGGATSQAFALAFPRRVSSLILMNTPIFGTFVSQRMSPLVQWIRNDTYRQSITGYLEASSIKGMLLNYNQNYPGPPYGRNISTEGFVLQVPTLFLWGTEDPYFSPKLTDNLQPWFAKGVRENRRAQDQQPKARRQIRASA